MSYITLIEHYRVHFSMVQEHKYSLAEVENMYPFERDLYIDMILNWMDKRESKINE